MASPAHSASLTPARKHRKLLKTSSGTEEVWSEAIEQTFVQGLRAYWDSPYANHSSRGRSRWRNQYLVDYLHKNGIERTKKQVASHIQVLRNMWKGQPEFHLVAGGDDAPLDASDHSPPAPSVKLEEHYDTSNLISMDPDEIGSPNSEYKPFGFDTYSSLDTASSSTDSPRTISSLPETPESHTAPLHPHQIPRIHTNHSPLRHGHLRDINHHDDESHAHRPDDAVFSRKASMDAEPQNNRITALCLSAEGMTPFQVHVDALVPPSQSGPTPPVMIHTRLAVAQPTDATCPQAFQGFSAMVTVARVWSNFASCVTRVFVGRSCVSEESNALDVNRIELGNVIASLPFSPLSRCRWLDPALPTNIVQDIVVDSVPVFRLIYQLDRAHTCSYPSVELLSFARVPSSGIANAKPVPPPTSEVRRHQHFRSSSSSSSYSIPPQSPYSPSSGSPTSPSSIHAFGMVPAGSTTSPMSSHSMTF